MYHRLVYDTQYMPQVSRWKLTKKTETELVKQLKLVLTKVSKIEEMSFFLDTFLTETERLMLAKRLAIAILLKEEISESQIAATLHVTRMTVSRTRYYLDAHGQGYEIAFQKIAREKDLIDLKIILLKLANYSVKAAGGRI